MNKENRFVIQVDPLEIEDDAIYDNKELRLYECQSDMMSDICSLLNKQDQRIAELEEQLAEMQNEKAIRELEKLRKQLDCEDNYCYGDNNIVICINRTIFNNIIDNQIKSLKGEK